MGVTIPFKRPDGKDASGYLAHCGEAKAPGVVVIQEWWGLQDQIKGLCDRFAAAGFDALAPDLYRGTVVGSWSVGGPYTIAASYSVDYQLGDVRRNLFRDERVLRHVVRLGVTIAPSFSRSFLPPDEAARAKGVSR